MAKTKTHNSANFCKKKDIRIQQFERVNNNIYA